MLPSVAKDLESLGYYVEVDNTHVAQISQTSSMVICWDPMVNVAKKARDSFVDPSMFQLYITIMQYVRAEKSIEDLTINPKSEIQINGFITRKWVSISLVTADMYEEALAVGTFLWDNAYYVGICKDNRRRLAWTMFVCWEPSIVKTKGEHDEVFTFNGEIPKTWS